MIASPQTNALRKQLPASLDNIDMIKGSNKSNWHILALFKYFSHVVINKHTWQLKRKKTLTRQGKQWACVASQQPRNQISIHQLTSKPRPYRGAKNNTLAYKYVTSQLVQYEQRRSCKTKLTSIHGYHHLFSLHPIIKFYLVSMRYLVPIMLLVPFLRLYKLKKKRKEQKFSLAKILSERISKMLLGQMTATNQCHFMYHPYLGM